MVWSTLKGKNLLSEEHVFSFKSRPVWMGFIIRGRPREVKKVILALKMAEKKHGNVPSHNNIFDNLHFVHRMFIVHSGKPKFLGRNVYKIMHVFI